MKITIHIVVIVLFTLLSSKVFAIKPPEQIMRANCASCHGELGEGGVSWINPAKNAFQIAGRPLKSITKWVRQGRPPQMPAFHSNEISDEELDALAVYINALPGSYVPPPTAEHTVTITDEDGWYSPMQIRVTQGDTVKFVNTGSTYHPVTQINYVATQGIDGTDSGLLGPNGEYYRTFDTPGKHLFLCKIHPYMRGEVYVDADIEPLTYSVREPQPLPTVTGVGEVWVLAQFQDFPGKAKDGVIQVINTGNWSITVIPVGNNPHNIWFTQGSERAIITNWFDNTITEMDANTKEVIETHIAGAAPAHVTSDHNGDKLYVSIEGSRYIQVFSPQPMRLENKPIFVGGAGPHGIWFGGDVLMTSNSLDNTVSFVDTASNDELGTLDTDLYPLGASLTSDGAKGFAGNCLAGTVSIYHVKPTLSYSQSLAIGGCPVQVPVSPDDKYVVVPNSPHTTVIDAVNETVIAQFETGNGAHGATFTPKADGSGWYAYITHKLENHVSVIDLPFDTNIAPSHAGDIPLQLPSTTGKTTVFGATDTGGNGIAARPLLAPWL